MTKWVILEQLSDEATVYGRIDEDGLMRVTAIEGYADLDEWLAEGNTPEVIED
jgi:hypothetical protein